MFDIEFLRVLVIGLLALPTTAAAAVALLGPARGNVIRWISLGTVLAGLVLAVTLAAGLVAIRENTAQQSAQKLKSGEAAFTKGIKTFTPEIVPGGTAEEPHRTNWRMIDLGPVGGVDFFLGVDGLNIWLLVLTAVLMVSSVLISWTSITERVNEYFAWLLLLSAAMLGVFLAFDIILFYIFFELTLVPLFFLIGIWGGPERRRAAAKFFIFTFAGSVITLLGLLAVVVVCYDRPLVPNTPRVLTFSIPDLISIVNGHLKNATLSPNAAELAFWHNFQFWVFLALIAGFAIKVPLVPVHTWLPLAHTEAPTAGSVLLAGVLLKVGAYGFLRLCLPLTPDACWSVGLPLIGTLAVIGIIYGAFCALAQDDIKKLVAYSSVSHMGFCLLGMFALNEAGLTGSLLQMLNHGLSTGALFLLVGMLYERYHTRKMADYGGMGARLGLLACCWVFITLSSIGLPGLNGFVGEALVFFGMFQVRPEVSTVARGLAIAGTAGIVLGAWYMLNLTRAVFFGPLKEPAHHGPPVKDVNLREWAALVPILALCVVLGVYPQPAINVAKDDLQVVESLVRKLPPGPQHGPAISQEGSNPKH